MINELFELYKRNFPFIVRDDGSVLDILGNKNNQILEKRNDQGELIGASVINQNAILLLCVDKEYRNRGIGTNLLTDSEASIRDNGYDEIIVGNGFDYIMPGVPTCKRYFHAENESLYDGLDETASSFFANRGYEHSRDCDCFDMRFSLKDFNHNEYNIGDTICGVHYRWAEITDMEEICRCTDDALGEFTQWYQAENLYREDSDDRVLIAAVGSEAAGALIVSRKADGKFLGSIGCTAVKHTYRGRQIATNLVILGTRYLKDTGMKEAYLSYTYTGLDRLYGCAGYQICIYYMMARKKLLPDVFPVRKG